MSEITKHHKKDDQIKVLYKLMEKHTEGILISDFDEQIIWCNSGFLKLIGYNKDEVIGKAIKDFLQFNKGALAEKIDDQKDYQEEIIIKNKEGQEINILIKVFNVLDDKKRISYLAAVCTDITEVKIQEGKIYELAYTDTVTTLFNRDYFVEKITYEIKQAKSKNEKIGVIFFDLDNFKSINDTLGHKIGDKVLKLFGDELKKLVKENDIIARLGGDEFVCLLTNINDEKDVLEVVHNINYIFKNPVIIDHKEFYISSSIGISIFPDDTTNAYELMNNADIALYKAKNEKEKTMIRFTRQMKEELDEQFTLSNHLRKAIKKEELSVHYQPIVNIDNEEIISAEALLRWNHSQYGYISPTKFIPIAEANGLINEIGEWVLNEVCKQNKKWQEQGFKKIPIAVNISVKQLEEKDFAQKVFSILDTYKLDAQYLELEITESISINNLNNILSELQKLKDKGIKISIDDFGTGYSSLGKLKKLSINKLKIDRSFINDLNGEDENELVTAIIAMANSLGLNIIAEGIETENQLKFLQNKKCIFGQGYLFSKPLIQEEFEKFL
ncbi:PAS domain S-box-containing protein/diguanylate cyclase (GGDEF)-like protein [Natranaerovirga hydrolytica]|uniref:PAS domain S-box-containing protein/diguanylate cyclase (GGDEF)-like protein n=1 Tax=Natranaerovirga hydrolytica TaxID=680378 RepID=A0A4R1MYS9_9FIRM|nr:EAL domain-containing protein [Natranaerovirga hydrolytica]TCK98468.1 PAS domain S-box-containing protein/diguanylate cyclase (GGDEF)-like protein [Natranaerovirga hydrolytica]